ncbi:acyltransferase family protein [Pimelobacter simplex]|uniref:O-antigen acetylase n=1 Tax=Nocardioides simplex TaxID=2045 RepID=A0A0C5XKQ5_NOCSI|nr:acyltransferase family protein [Pimelobacter simplex]AJR18082.1 O-antigen acetylase [Pimelobacter simplex]MCG8151033.1 acyltransferase family protein [Pimelobacter simplex]GEB12335.1 acyltransferase [Pimelobacter simplex]SFM96383.1 Peptidoglycan/LPS O-acetylase OafA/YrhL, contains acyltransferase and SGNH-hydrolase domains [Pimelobacter simplex]
MPPAPAPHGESEFRAEVQGLRAVAVLLVVLYHLAPARLSGGYVGVDVFFVISGYLITRHLAQEAEVSSGLRVVRFWARRVRRLLPAALLVLLVSLVLVWAWIPQTEWPTNVRQVVASALYVQNWVLMLDAVDYSALGESASVAQHYWSLSVEEQFYFVWPVAIAVVLAVITRRHRRVVSAERVRQSLVVLLAAVGAASLAWSVVATATDPGAAYFQTFTRMWEFAAGGLVGLLWQRRRLTGHGGAAVAWAGLVAIVLAGVLYDDTTPFPGWLAIVPVAGTVAVLLAGHARTRTAPHWLTWRPATFVGDISYAVYLWHWPLIVVAPFALGHEPDRYDKIGVLGLSLLLAWCSTRFVEDPLRGGAFLRPVPRALVAGAVAMAVVVAAAAGLRSALPAEQDFALPSPSSCTGPGALDPANHCDSVVGEGPARPGPVQVARQNREEVAYPGCQASFASSELVSCDLGADAGSARREVALVGDSHAGAWFPAFDEIGRREGWQVRTYAKTSCPATLALRVLPAEKDPDYQRDCADWVRKLDRAVRADTSLDAVVVASYSTAYDFVPPDDMTMTDPATDGFVALWQRWRDAGLEVIVLADVPRTNGDYVPTCLAEHRDPMRCAVPRTVGLPAQRPITDAGGKAEGRGVALVDLTDRFCDGRWCYPQVGSVIVYRDYSHLSREYARSLAPEIIRRLPSFPRRASAGAAPVP